MYSSRYLSPQNTITLSTAASDKSGSIIDRVTVVPDTIEAISRTGGGVSTISAVSMRSADVMTPLIGSVIVRVVK